MEKLFKLLAVLLLTVFALPVLAESGDGAVQYEISMPAKAVKDVMPNIEAADAYKNASCSSHAKGKGKVVIVCDKPDAQSDALIRGLLKPGVSIKLSAAAHKQKAKSAASVCPTGCKWGTTCNPGGACCKINSPGTTC